MNLPSSVVLLVSAFVCLAAPNCDAERPEAEWFRNIVRSESSEKPEEAISNIAKEIRTAEDYRKLKELLTAASVSKTSDRDVEKAIRVVGRLKKDNASVVLEPFVNSDRYEERVAACQSLAEAGDLHALTWGVFVNGKGICNPRDGEICRSSFSFARRYA